MIASRLLILGSAFVVALAGCGQKGPLYLPPPAPVPQSKAPDEAQERPTIRAPSDVPSTSEKR